MLQGKVSNFETDLFTPLIERAAELTKFEELDEFAELEAISSSPGFKGVAASLNAPELLSKAKLISVVGNASLRIIADHARAATFLINDGVLPSNEGRGYVLRKILRRGIRHGRQLGQEKPFLFKMVYAVRDLMQGAYPELLDSADRVARVVEAEEKQFARVLAIGYRWLQTALVSHRLTLNPDATNRQLREWFGQDISEGDWGDLKPRIFSGEDAFHLYETYGLPKDFIQDACHDAGIEFDEAGFEAARAEEQARARASWKGGSQKSASPAFRELPKTTFEGYRQLNSTNCEVLAIVKDGVGVPAAAAGDEVEIVLDHTSFYGDSGGQVGDTGWFTSTDGNATVAEITGCVLPVQGVRAHKAVLKQPLAVGDRVQHCRRRRAAQRHPPQSHRNAPAARGIAPGSGHACEAGRLGGASGSAAL